MNPAVQELVALLLATRKAHGVKKSAVAAACNQRVSVITHVERGEIEPTLSLLLDYADAVGLVLAWRCGAKPRVPVWTNDRH